MDRVLLNHEQIHLIQQLELLVVPFFIWYGIEFLIRLQHYGKWHEAYRNISFEREAFANELQAGYMEQRGFWQFLEYLRTHDFPTKK